MAGRPRQPLSRSSDVKQSLVSPEPEQQYGEEGD